MSSPPNMNILKLQCRTNENIFKIEILGNYEYLLNCYLRPNDNFVKCSIFSGNEWIFLTSFPFICLVSLTHSQKKFYKKCYQFSSEEVGNISFPTESFFSSFLSLDSSCFFQSQWQENMFRIRIRIGSVFIDLLDPYFKNGFGSRYLSNTKIVKKNCYWKIIDKIAFLASNWFLKSSIFFK